MAVDFFIKAQFQGQITVSYRLRYLCMICQNGTALGYYMLFAGDGPS